MTWTVDHTTTSQVENDIILLRIQPLHDLCSQLRDKGRGMLVGLGWQKYGG